MKVTDKVIMDLLPLYFAGEASEDTRVLVEFYFKEHPEFAERMQEHSTTDLSVELPLTLKPEDEMIVLRKTKKFLRLRTNFLVIAIFCSLLPFAFGDVSWDEIEGAHWLWYNYPEGAIVSGAIGLISWIGYFIIRNRLRVTAL